MRAIPLGLAAAFLSGAALAQTNTPHTDHGRSAITNAPVATDSRSVTPGTTAQGTQQGPSSITNAPPGAAASGTATQDAPRRP